MLPLLATRAGLDVQIETGLASHHRRFGPSSGFWLPETKIDRKSSPTLGEIFRDQLTSKGLPKEVTAEAIDADLAKDSVKNLY